MIHQYKQNGFNIVLDVNSGGVHIVDDVTYDVLSCLEPPLLDEMPQIVADTLASVSYTHLAQIFGQRYCAGGHYQKIWCGYFASLGCIL